MRPFTSTISLDEARRRSTRSGPPDRAHRARARSRTRPDASPPPTSTSPIDVPPFARSAMDGYAVVAADTARRDARRARRACASLDRIYTGQMSRGHDRARHVRRDRHRRAAARRRRRGRDGRGDGEERRRRRRRSSRRRRAGQNIGRRGADIAAGDRVVAAGDLLTPSRVGALAAIGCADVEVFARRASRFCRPATRSSSRDSRCAPGQIYDVNRFTLGAIVAAHGGVPEPHRAAQDTRRRADRRRSTPAPTPTSSCFRAAARSASAISSSTRSPRAAR